MYFGAIIPTALSEKYIWVAVILLIVGLVAIIKGGDWFVDAAVWMAEVLHMPKFLIGATIVSLATTLPEMIVSVIDTCTAVAVANGGGTADFSIAIGNAVGSVTANTGLIMAISAVFVLSHVDKKDFGFKALLIIVIGVILLGFSLSGKFGIVPSIMVLILFIIYMVQTAKTAKTLFEQKHEEEETVDKSKKAIWSNIGLFVIGTIGIVLGADLLVENAKIVAKAAGISDGIIAVTLVAIGTSLPELITTITSIVKKQGELGVGNIIGANIIDMALILPICSFITGGQLTVTPQSMYLDMPALLAVSLVVVVPTYITGKLKKWQGFTLLALYAAYITIAVLVFNAA